MFNPCAMLDRIRNIVRRVHRTGDRRLTNAVTGMIWPRRKNSLRRLHCDGDNKAPDRLAPVDGGKPSEQPRESFVHEISRREFQPS
jgi:hypothetical protein